VKAGDRVLVLCTVTEADEHTFTMMVSAIVYNHHGEQLTEITEVDVLLQDGQR
jgi:hypothetical protein